MRKIILFPVFVFYFLNSFAQEAEQKNVDTDTTRFKLGKSQVIVIGENGKGKKVEYSSKNEEQDIDTVDASPSEAEQIHNEAHWAGMDLGFGVLLNSNGNTNFGKHDYWNNDPAKSIAFNLNLLEHKFSIYKSYIGITTGLGFGFTQVAFKNNYLLQSSKDSLFATIDTTANYSKNKLRASYLQVPLLLEFCSSQDEDFYLAAGVVGGVRLTSKVKRIGKELDGKEFEIKNKGTYGLNPFKLDAMVRFGYADWGAFASYSLLPVFDTKLTDEIHPFTFGMTLNF